MALFNGFSRQTDCKMMFAKCYSRNMFTRSSFTQICTFQIASTQHAASPETQEGQEWQQLIRGCNWQVLEWFTKFRGLSEQKRGQTGRREGAGGTICSCGFGEGFFCQRAAAKGPAAFTSVWSASEQSFWPAAHHKALKKIDSSPFFFNI